MARTSTRNVNPSLSSDPRDKLVAALNYSHGKSRQGVAYELAPMYFDACWALFQRLSAEDQDLVLTLADVMGSAHMGVAECMATALPPAPRCPL